MDVFERISRQESLQRLDSKAILNVVQLVREVKHVEFLEWLTGMGLMFYGWILPIAVGVYYINELKGTIVVGILICLLAVPIEIILYRLYRKLKNKRERSEKAIRQAIEQERNRKEEERKERIKTSPIKSLSPLQFEEYTKFYLEQQNYRDVSLTRTSGDFGADVIAIAPDNVRVCVQCKKYSKPVGVSAVQEIYSAKSYYKCDRASVVATSAGFTKQAIQLSEKVNVFLFAYDDYTREFKPINRCARSFLQNKH